ncbi:MAG: hypothetical protein LBP85_08475 [Prevotellaceae bacterium]|jgi:hypothetical protein|nr:hypothetical protein [Prevotellaceae bacterium]
MKTIEKNNKMVALFHLNRGKLEFYEFCDICDLPIWDDLFISESGELTDWNGRVLMDAEELTDAQATGVGRIEIDGHYDTWYSCYVEDMDENELQEMMFPNKGFRYLDNDLDKALVEFGFDETAVVIARHFDDFEELYNCHLFRCSYIKENFDVTDSITDDEDREYCRYKDKYYIKSNE